MEVYVLIFHTHRFLMLVISIIYLINDLLISFIVTIFIIHIINVNFHLITNNLYLSCCVGNLYFIKEMMEIMGINLANVYFLYRVIFILLYRYYLIILNFLIITDEFY
jgi:hypothetical protein